MTLSCHNPQIVVTDSIDCFGGNTAAIQLLNPDTTFNNIGGYYYLYEVGTGFVASLSSFIW